MSRPTLLRAAVVTLTAALILLFLLSQHQQSDLTFDRRLPTPVELSTPDQEPALPTAKEIRDLLTADRVVRLPGAEAVYDEAVVDPLLGKHQLRLLLLPAGVSTESITGLDLPSDVIVISGLRVNLDILRAVPANHRELANVFAGRDVTDGILALIDNQANRDGAGLDLSVHEVDRVAWREPTAEEMAAILPALTEDSIVAVDGADPGPLPFVAAEAFPTAAPLVILAPHASPGVASVDYRAAVEQALPGRPVIQLTGQWVTFAGLEAEQYAEAVTAGFYGAYEEILADGTYPQRTVLSAALSRIAEYQYSGIFERPVPEAGPDPVEVTLPWLPWVFAAMALGYVVLLVRDLRPQQTAAGSTDAEVTATLAGLSEIAVQLSRHATTQRAPSLARAMALLSVARDAVEAGDHQRASDQAELAANELDTAAIAGGLESLRPDEFLPGRWR